ncbi:Rha family transcriptional regulator [Methylobacterium tarhaniae]|uniref:Rha family transcriptional regulator n=1 Tax=Methylobacterium tarhaniae TaxID=1187852 RepID=UPI003CFE121F
MNGQPHTTSGTPAATLASAMPLTMCTTEIAKRTKKRHSDVMRDVRTMLQQLGTDERSFASVYQDSKGERRPCFNLPKRECMILVTGYSIPLRAAVMDRWLELEEHTAAPMPSRIGPDPREARLTFKHHLGIAKMLKLEGNQAVLAANRATKAMCGVDPLGAMGITHVTAPQNEPLLNCTDIGKRLGDYSAQEVNRYLVQFGYQVALRDAKDRLYYEVTDLGREAGGVMQDTGKSHNDGTPVRQLRWASGIVTKLRADIAKPETIHG